MTAAGSELVGCRTVTLMSGSQGTPQVVRFADFRLDLRSGELWKNGGDRVLLPDQPFKILRALIQRRGALVTRDELRQELWPADTFVDFEHGLNAAVKRLREVLADSASGPQLIETIPRRGYRLMVAVETEPSQPAIDEPPAPIAPALIEQQRGPARWQRTGIPVGPIVATVLVTIGLLAWRVWASRSSDHVTTRAVPARITSTSGLNIDPALSRDGTLVAFASDRADGGNLDIWVQAVAGGKAMPLTSTAADESEPAFSADGSQVVYTQRGTGIHIVDTMGGSPRLVVSTPWGRTPRFSPDGQSIVYWTGFPASVIAGGIPGALGSIYVVSSGGGNPREIETGLPSARYPIWAPDGHHLLFLGEENTDDKTHDWYVVDVRGGKPVKTGVADVLRSAGLSARFPIPGSWSARGDAVVFATNEVDSSNIWQIPVSPAGKVLGAPEQVTIATAIDRYPTFGESGRVAFASLVENVDIWRVPVDPAGRVTGPPERVTDDAGSDRVRTVSADGRILTFISSRTKRDEVWRKDLATGREEQVTFVGVEDASASPEGELVAYARTEKGRSLVEIQDRMDSTRSPVCDGCYGASDWSPDGRRLLLGSGHPSRIMLYDVGTKGLREVTSHPAWSLQLQRFDPDGKWVAFHTTNTPNVRQIFAVRVPEQGGVAQGDWVPIVTDHGCHPNWSPDGTLVYYFSFRDGAFCLYVQEVDRTTRRPIGPARGVQHFHNPRLRATSGAAAFNDVATGYVYMSLTETTGNVWFIDPAVKNGR